MKKYFSTENKILRKILVLKCMTGEDKIWGFHTTHSLYATIYYINYFV